jgi:hypothetical protein
MTSKKYKSRIGQNQHNDLIVQQMEQATKRAQELAAENAALKEQNIQLQEDCHYWQYRHKSVHQLHIADQFEIARLSKLVDQLYDDLENKEHVS